MRQFFVIAMLVAGFTTTAWAGEFERNPDRFSSIGISIGLAGAGGDTTVKAGGASADQDVSVGTFDLTIDSRIPVSNSMTLFGGFSVFAQSSEADETVSLSGSETDLAGFALRAGMRIYFNR